MGFENARDSFNDLQEMGKTSSSGGRRQKNTYYKNGSSRDNKKASFRILKKAGLATSGGGGLGGASDSLNDLRLINYRKSRPPSPDWNYGYEISDRTDEDSEDGDDQWPIFELTASKGENYLWKENGSSASAAVYESPGEENRRFASSSNGEIIAAPTIFDCERVFTVHEVFDELQSTRTLQQLSSLALRVSSSVLRDERSSTSPSLEQCSQKFQNILHCLTPWKQQNEPCCHRENQMQQPCHRNDAFIQTQPLLPNEKVSPHRIIAERISMAVLLYSGLPPSMRRSFAPSMFKIRHYDDDTHDAYHHECNERTACLVGYDHRYVYSLGRDSIFNNRSTTTTTFPSPSDHSTSNENHHYRVHFSEIKRVLKVRKFTRNEALDVWFQRDDFEHFKAEMSLLIQEVEASRELAEAWLDPKGNSVASNTSDSNNNIGKVDDNTSSDNQGHISASSTNCDDGILENGSPEGRNSRGKARAWWHDYDHSRRGLERYASPGQARQILASYKVAVQKVLGEQRRQRILGFFCIPNAYDPEKIAEVYHEYTAWSRDLALAAGASDADAVSTDFDDDKRHTREYYVLKQVIASGFKVHKHMPQFMLPRCITPTGYLNETESLHHEKEKDEITEDTSRGSKIWQLLRRNSSTGEEAREQMSRVHKSDLKGPVAPSLAPILQVNEEGKDLHLIHGNGVHHHSMAEKAKNFPFQK